MDALEVIASISSINENNIMLNRRIKTYKERRNPFVIYDEHEFKSKYRFNKSTVEYIVSLVSEELQRDRRGGGITPELQVLTALRCWGRREVQDDCGDLHGMGQSTVSAVCNRVAHAIARLAPDFIKMPSGINEENRVMTDFKRISNFPSVIGALDCTHIKIRKTGGDQAQYYINRKGFYSLNVQAVCDAQLRILNLVARWRGCTHDSRIFSESSLKTRFEQGEFTGRLLGDSGYPLLPFLFTPILRPANIREERYNRAHIKTRNTIERCFGVLKQRFQCLLFGLTGRLENAKIVIVALAVLHNIAINRNDQIAEEEVIPSRSQGEHYVEVLTPNTVQARQGRYVLSSFIDRHFT